MRAAFVTGILVTLTANLILAQDDFSSSFPEREFEKEQRKKLDDGVGGIMALFIPRKNDETGIFNNPKVANDVSSWFDNIGIMQQVIDDEGLPGLMKLFQELMNGQGAIPGLGGAGLGGAGLGGGAGGGLGKTLGALKGIPGLDKWTNPSGAVSGGSERGAPPQEVAPPQPQTPDNGQRTGQTPASGAWSVQTNNGNGNGHTNNGRRPEVPPGQELKGSGLRPGASG